MYHFKQYILPLACSALVMSVTSCKDDGYDNNESWSTSVRNAQLENPTELSYTKASTSDTEKTIVFSWNVVHGAEGYMINVTDISNPAEEKIIIADSLIDRCSVALTLPNENNYELAFQTIGSKKLNNQNAVDAIILKFDTYVPSKLIPTDAEIASWIASNLEDKDIEQGIMLEAGATYYLNDTADFRLNNVEFRGDKNNAPIIIVGDSGCFMTQGGLKIRDLKIDCSQTQSKSVLFLSDQPDDRLSTEALGYRALKSADQEGFVIQKPVIFQNCQIKDMPNSLLHGSKQNWTLLDFRIQNCIIQMNSESKQPVIKLDEARNGLIQKLNISNSTFYNIVRNENEAYFMRFSNSSSAQPKKVLGEPNNFLEYTICNNSFIRTNPKKDFANNLPNTQNEGRLWIKMTGNVFFDVYRIYQMIQSQWVKTTTGNYSSYSDFSSVSGNDVAPTGRTDSNGNYYTTLDEEPAFNEDQLKSLDFSKTDFGVSLAPAGTAGENKSGDPRWY